MLRKICGPKRDEVTEGSVEDCITRGVYGLYSPPSIIRVINIEECDGRGM